MLLVRQADLLAQSPHPRIAANQSKFGIIEDLPVYPHRAKRGSAIQSFQSAVLVAQTAIGRLWCKLKPTERSVIR